MSLKVINGLRGVDGANSGMDIDIQAIVFGNTVNGAVHDMVAHFELLFLCLNDDVDAGATLVFHAQESNEAAANFTNITGASVTVAAEVANTVELLSIDWKNPDRKRYARVCATVTGANNADVGAVGLRLQEHAGDKAIDTNVDETT